jgi:hypothetical protein
MDQLLAGLLPSEDVLKVAVTAEAAGVMHSTFYMAGRPGAATTPSPGLAGAALTSYAGQIPFPAAAGGENIHLARFEASQAANVGSVSLLDRLWHNSGIGITTTGAQTVNSVAFPARDAGGSTNGNGVLVALEASAAVGGAAINNTTLSYTNQAGTPGRTATLAWPATAAAGTFVPFMLAAGDTGVRSIQSLTLGTTYASGTVHLVAYRQIATLGTPLANVSVDRDAFALAMPRMYDNSVPFMVYLASGTAVGIVDAQISYTQG